MATNQEQNRKRVEILFAMFLMAMRSKSPQEALNSARGFVQCAREQGYNIEQLLSSD